MFKIKLIIIDKLCSKYFSACRFCARILKSNVILDVQCSNHIKETLSTIVGTKKEWKHFFLKQGKNRSYTSLSRKKLWKGIGINFGHKGLIFKPFVGIGVFSTRTKTWKVGTHKVNCWKQKFYLIAFFSSHRSPHVEFWINVFLQYGFET